MEFTAEYDPWMDYRGEGWMHVSSVNCSVEGIKIMVNHRSLFCSWQGWHLHTPNTWFWLRVTLTYPPTPLLQKILSCAWGEKKLNSSILTWSEEEEWSSEVAETSTKWWCNACYSVPCEACRGLSDGSGFRGRCFWRDYCSVVSGLYFRHCVRLGVEHCLNVFSCGYSRVELVIYVVYGAF